MYSSLRIASPVLRVVNTQTESIATSIREESRRRLRRTSKLFSSPSSNLNDSTQMGRSRSKSLFSRATLRARGKSVGEEANNATARVQDEETGRAELDRLQTQRNAAAESKEAARRQDRQDRTFNSKEPQPQSWKNWTGYRTESTSPPKLKKKERRTVYLNVEGGGATNPKGYERNKVRTSKYTLLTFVPKVISL